MGLETTEFESDDYVELRKDMESNKNQLPDIKVVDGFIFKRNQDCGNPELEEHSWKLWVPSSLTPMLIDSPHTKVYGGIAKTLSFLRQRFYWPGMVA